MIALTRKHILKLEEKNCIQKLNDLYDLKHKVALQQAMQKQPPHVVGKMQSYIDSVIVTTKLQLRAITLVRAYERHIPRDVIEKKCNWLGKYQTTRLLNYVAVYLNAFTLNCHVMTCFIQWANIQDYEYFSFVRKQAS